jgi:hypothetical protein
MHLFNTKRLEQDESLGLQVPEKNLLYNTRDKLKRKAIITNLQNEWLNYQRTGNKANKELRNAKNIIVFHENFLVISPILRRLGRLYYYI